MSGPSLGATRHHQHARREAMRYEIRFQTEDWYVLYVEADSEDEALERFHSDPFSDAICTDTGTIQDSYEIGVAA